MKFLKYDQDKFSMADNVNNPELMIPQSIHKTMMQLINEERWDMAYSIMSHIMGGVPTDCVSSVLAYGAKKYGPKNRYEVGCNTEEVIKRFKDATFRHYMLYLEYEESADNESGYPHSYHVLTNIFIIMELISNKEAI